MKVETESSLI